MNISRRDEHPKCLGTTKESLGQKTVHRLLAGRFSSSCGASMATLLEKRQSIALLFAADQKDQFFFHIFCAFCWLSLVSLSPCPKSSQPQPLLKNHGKVAWFWESGAFFFQKLHQPIRGGQLTNCYPGYPPDGFTTSNLQFGHGTIDPFACVVIRATFRDVFLRIPGSFWRVWEINRRPTSICLTLGILEHFCQGIFKSKVSLVVFPILAINPVVLPHDSKHCVTSEPF